MYADFIAPDEALESCFSDMSGESEWIDGTWVDFPQVKREIERLSSDYQKKYKRQKSKYYRNLGQVTHYLADYFTFPHNKIYPGNLKDHCAYEEKLKISLREYLKTPEVLEHAKKTIEFQTPEALIAFIQKSHDEYLERKKGVEEDIKSIVVMNEQAVHSITEFFRQAKQKRHVQQF